MSVSKDAAAMDTSATLKAPNIPAFRSHKMWWTMECHSLNNYQRPIKAHCRYSTLRYHAFTFP